MTTRWKISRPLLQRARKELAFLISDPKVKAEIERVLNLLAEQEDPRKPDPALGLDVLRVEHAAPDWFRISLLPKYNKGGQHSLPDRRVYGVYTQSPSPRLGLSPASKSS